MTFENGIQKEPLLEVRNFDKRYGGVHALKNVSWSIAPGEVCGLVGENGAGKSTLIKQISGAEKPDTGELIVEGESIDLGDTKASLAAGISPVYQEPSLFADLTVAENVFLGREISSKGRVHWSEQEEKVVSLLQRLGLDPSIMNVRAGDLAAGEQQLVSIAKAFVTDVKVLILDEPSAILTDKDIDRLFSTIRALKAEGVGIIYISHRLDELTQITDRITVLRDGELIGNYPTKEMSTAKIASLMVGEKFQIAERKAENDRITDEVVVSVKDLAYGRRLKSANFDLHKGEILGVYGLIGSGATELARCLFGIHHPTGGTVSLFGEAKGVKSPREAIEKGMTMLPGNRKLQGVFLPKTLSFNLASSHLNYFSKGPLFKASRAEETMADMIGKLNIKAPSPSTIISALSGGNQQKVVMARQLVREPKILIAEEPTQGVDVGAKGEIHKLILDHVAKGNSALVLSTDLEEIRFLCDRIVVLRNGVTATTLPGTVSAADLLNAASGEQEQAEEVV